LQEVFCPNRTDFTIEKGEETAGIAIIELVEGSHSAFEVL